jgi:serine/threonine-protein kinase
MLHRSEMLICPKCRTTYSSSLVEACYRDGERLVDYDRFVAEENDPLRGVAIAGKYRIVERVGQGGMGTVYRAVQAGLNRDVAVKILKRELNVDRDTVARFHREANAMSLLTHANTVRVYDFGQTDDGLLYLVMELLEGELITERIRRLGVLDVNEAIRFTQQILRSLAEAHRKAIVHRDLKPDNIFVARVDGQEEPVIKVLDFGIAKVVAPDRRVDQFETQAGTVFGTPRYMSPEQAQGGTLDGRSDLYSVGTLLYQMLTGRAPFVDDDAVVVMAKHIREVPDAPRVAAPDRPIPASLDGVVMRALEKDPGLRFQEAAEFDAALEACFEEALRERTRPIEAMESFRPRTFKTSSAIATTAALVLLGYMGFRVLASDTPVPVTVPVVHVPGEPRTTVVTNAESQDRADTNTAAPVAEAGQPPAVAPALVAIRSEPAGAAVIRDGKHIGATPLDLQVSKEEQEAGVVRVELRSKGFEPLLAELNPTQGERVFKLSPSVATTEIATSGGVKRARPAGKPSKANPKPARPARPATTTTTPKEPSTPEDPKGVYERFE